MPTLLIAAPPLLWLAFTADIIDPQVHDGITPSKTGQAIYILHHPRTVAQVLLTTLRTHCREFLDEAIGVMGWLDTRMPGWYYGLARYALGAALLADWLGSTPRTPRARGLLLLGILGSIAGIMLTMYMTWTQVAADMVAGIQGRYALPAMMFLGLATPPGMRQGPLTMTLRALCCVLVVILPVVTMANVPWTIIARYFLH